MTDRPDGACLAHRPPPEGKAWRRADPGYRTCSACYQQLHDWLSVLTVDDDGRPASIPGLYVALDPRPGVTGGGARRAPGFGSRSPANDHIISIQDARSTQVEESDPLSVPGVLTAWCDEIVEERNAVPPARDVPSLARFIDAHLDYATRQDWAGDLFTELRALHSQLRAIGQQRRKIGSCPNTLDEGDTTRQCGATLMAPLYGDTIRCWSCNREWPRHEWLRLGHLLGTEAS